MPADAALRNGVNKLSVEKSESCNSQINGNLESIGSMAMIKSKGNQSVIIALFKKSTEHNSGSDLSQRGSGSNNSRK